MEAFRSRIVRHEMRDPRDLPPNPLNWRPHPEEQAAALTGILDEVGWVQGVVVNERTGNLIDGHLRVELAIAEGEAEIPVTVVDLTEEEERKILATFDPLAAMAGEDSARLHELLAGIHTENAAVAALLRNLGQPAPPPRTDPDAVPEPPAEPITMPGDLWLLGKHRLVCGDAMAARDVLRLLRGRRPHMVYCDPPYGMGLETDWTGITGSLNESVQTAGNKYRPVIGDDRDFDPSFILGFFSRIKEVFLWGGDYYCHSLPQGGSWIVWDKRKPNGQERAIGSAFEMLWSKAPHKREILRHDWFGFLSSGNSVEARHRVHPTQKPTSLHRDVFERWLKGDLVVDLFSGSGSTMMACEQMNLACYAMEIDVHYCDVTVRRWEEFTGRKAERIHGGRSDGSD